MLGWFKQKSEKEKLLIQYKKLMEEAYTLSKTDRAASDAKTAEAAVIMLKIESLASEI